MIVFSWIKYLYKNLRFWGDIYILPEANITCRHSKDKIWDLLPPYQGEEFDIVYTRVPRDKNRGNTPQRLPHVMHSSVMYML